MTTKKIVIFGMAEQAEIAGFMFENDSPYSVAAYCVNRDYLTKTSFSGKPVYAFEEIQSIFNPLDYYMFVAVGYSKLNKLRAAVCEKARQKGYKLASYISSKAIVWQDLSYGDNCFILEGNNIQPFVKIGDNVTLWSGNHIGHHSQIDDNVFISSHVVVSGGCRIKENTFIGVNATLTDHITVEKENVISAGALITKPTREFGVYTGSPAKERKLKSYQLASI